MCSLSPPSESNDSSEMSSSPIVKPVRKYNVQSLYKSDSTGCDITCNEDFLDFTEGYGDDEADKAPCDCHGLLFGNCPTHINNVLETAKAVVESGMPNKDCVKKPVGFLNTPAWKEKLAGYSDKDDVLNGIEFGWELGRKQEPKLVSIFHNHQSANDNAESIDKYIKEELSDGNLVGPLPPAHGLDITVSPLGSVHKPGSSKRRTIVDSSFPHGHGVNDSIPKNMYRDKYNKVELPTINDIVAGIRRAKQRFPGHKLLGYKLDLSK